MKRAKWIAAILLSTVMLAACGGAADEEAGQSQPVTIVEESLEPSTVEVEESSEEFTDEAPEEGMYRSELTGMWIPEDLRNQRPIAAMVDNEKGALDHFGVNAADIVYELMNSTANGRITRLMVVMKDYEKITQLGSIRSVRPSNFLLAAEYNAILLHDGGPWFIDEYVAKPYSTNISGDFARFSNGKKSEFTEYVTYEDYKNPTTGKSYSGLKKRIQKAKIDTEYNEYYPGEHFMFDPQGVDLSVYSNALDATMVKLPFPHNKSELHYNEETKTYDYYEYDMAHIDALDGGITSFKNAIIQSCGFFEYDDHGYMMFDMIGANSGYYLTEGKAIPITWAKVEEAGRTYFYNKETGEEITMNVGKTYIALVPSDNWAKLSIE